MAREMIWQGNEYSSNDGWIMKREYGFSPNGNPFDGRWVLRDAEMRY